MIIDRDDITLWRRKYLRQVRRYRGEGRKLYYLDETWVNEGHTTKKVWIDSTVTNKEKAFLSGKSTGLRNPSGKGKRLIVLHIGSDDGFIDGGLLLFESKKSGDYHEDMNGEVFKSWFEKILPKLTPGSIIIMDNAPYHSVKLNKQPTKAWRKQAIVSWLQENKIEFDANSIKAELLDIARTIQDKVAKYVIDDLAEKSGHFVLRLPPFHCNLNPIELIWSQIKGYVARHNTSFKLRDIRPLVELAASRVSADDWKKCIQHVIKEEERMWELDGMVDFVVDNLIINTADSSTESDDFDGRAPSDNEQIDKSIYDISHFLLLTTCIVITIF